MKASAARCLHIKPLPASAIPRIVPATQHTEAPVPGRAAAPSVAERLLADADRPANLRVEPYVSGKAKYWKVSEEQRTLLRRELREA
ncbi:Uncharacterized protein MSYG_0499 [Malassezia sympodialis ATCC 42132]|uniref:Uncharacterized protein n=1 Tax=Malassezia sympodialis (strain ATCC 42132) TaxID=1230383 RepID=A0A1M8A1U4_MALS4|nr:Uncharacterized protein MSYG_0499 [Malassezia sympodialis ATCC 42132]